MAFVKFRYKPIRPHGEDAIIEGTVARFKETVERKIAPFKQQIEANKGMVKVYIKSDLSDYTIHYYDLPVELIRKIDNALK